MPRKKRRPSDDMAKRLEAVRDRAGVTSLTEFHQRLVEDGTYEVSYQSVQNYHFDRPAPIDYLARVAEVFKADFRYLATGKLFEVPSGITLAVSSGSADITLQIADGDGKSPMLLEDHVGPDPKADEYTDADKYRDQQKGRQEVHTLLVHEAIEFTTEQTYFFGPLQQAGGAEASLTTIVDRVRRIAGRKGMMDPEPEGNLMPGLLAAPSEYEERLSAVLQSYQMFDELFGRAWKGMREIVAHEFGAEAGKSFTLQQQLRFADGLMLVLEGLFPDYGEPARFWEINDD